MSRFSLHVATRKATLVASIGFAVGLSPLGCHGHRSGEANKSEVKPPDDEVVAYPRGRWRLVPGHDLDRVVLWVSHILIRYDECNSQMPFNLGWSILPPPPQRTKREAFLLASRIASAATRNPSLFPRLASDYSEDPVTKDSGGSLGGLPVGNFNLTPTIIDALATMRPGEVSRPVETPAGFHVLYRRSRPEKVEFAARRLLVPYDGTTTSSNRPAGRGRSEALTVAAELVSRLRKDANAFDELIAKYRFEQDGPDGDIGVWTNHEPGALTREREQLAQAAVGEVVGPIDSPLGVQVFLRTPAGSRQQYAAAVVRLELSGNDDTAASRAAKLRTATSMARTLRKNPEAFSQFQQQYCCAGAQQWSQGRNDAWMSDAVARLEIGQVSPSPMEHNSGLVILKRLQPDPSLDAAGALFDIPLPEEPEVMRLAAGAAGTAVQKLVHRIGEQAVLELKLNETKAVQFKTLHEELERCFDMKLSVAQREQRVVEATGQIRDLLSPEQHQRYRKLVRDNVSSTLMALY